MTKKLTISALLVALAMIFSYVEVLIPFNFGIPGHQAWSCQPCGGGCPLSVGRQTGTDHLCCTNSACLLHLRQYGCTALQYRRRSSELHRDGALPEGQRPVHHGRQRAGGISHNIGQILVAVFVVKNLNLLFYLPVLMIAGIITGFLIGLVAGLIIPSVRKALQL